MMHAVVLTVAVPAREGSEGSQVLTVMLIMASLDTKGASQYSQIGFPVNVETENTAVAVLASDGKRRWCSS